MSEHLLFCAKQVKIYIVLIIHTKMLFYVIAKESSLLSRLGADDF